MSVSTVSARMDDGVKTAFERTLDQIGLTVSGAINVFARAVVRTGSIPFPLESGSATLLARAERLDRGEGVTKTLDELEAFARG
jgi:addiction module RelB/DinJ family antitoxin